ncbi:type IV secretion system protein [Candidatus Pantoea soli]|uniref:Type IV secretion system protein n=1 Tax=Candidatus Pantoea soli TaxID=3098669 RepID=A0A518XJV6_9GAMM|nr:type IV secretion system protein [Pantoea soli]QDY44473.1 type IV secretion system protein [Pantoea soli]
MAGTMEFFDQQVMTGLNSVTSGQMMQYSSWMMGLAGSAVAIYILLRGYQTMAGKLQTPAVDVIWDLSRLAIIFSFVANVDGYLDATINAIDGLKEGFSGGTNIWQMLDTLWLKAQTVAKTLHDLDDSTVVKDEGMTAQLFVWFGVMVIMVVCAFVSLLAEVTILLLSITAPLFIFCLAWGVFRQMFNNWLQNIFAGILTIMFSALSLRIVINILDRVLSQATTGAANANIVTLGAQVCLVAILGALLIWISAKIAGALAGASAGATMQGMATLGLAAAGFGMAKQVGAAAKGTKTDAKAQLAGWQAGNSGNKNVPAGGAAGYRAAQARQASIKQMQARAEQRNIVKAATDAKKRWSA